MNIYPQEPNILAFYDYPLVWTQYAYRVPLKHIKNYLYCNVNNGRVIKLGMHNTDIIRLLNNEISLRNLMLSSNDINLLEVSDIGDVLFEEKLTHLKEEYLPSETFTL
jgi:hypothetical protein